MKKIFGFLVAFVAVAMVSCSSGGGSFATPKELAEKSMECIQKKDYKGYVDLMYFSDKLKDDELKSTKEMYVNMMDQKLSESVDKAGGVKSFSVASEENVTDTTAVVKMNVVYGNDSTAVQDVKCKKAGDGWKIDSGK